MKETILDLLSALDGVPQDPLYHPEGDALFHSLQVFEHALAAGASGVLLAAALCHDVGKISGTRGHAERGAELLRGVLPEHALWLIRHHMDLIRRGRRTRRRLRNNERLRDLELLRRWDLAGRDPHALVSSPERCVEIVMQRLLSIPTHTLDARGGTADNNDKEHL